jgi:threonine/homoserine/homoserine lactone efflux protein
MIILPELDNILLFIATASLLIVMPGPSILYITAQSMEHGFKAGLISVLGIAVGGLVHVLMAGIGVSALLVSSAYIFSLLKTLGAIYLIYLGIRKILNKSQLNNDFPLNKRKKLPAIFYEGIITNVLNPKTAIFFFAFLPQFINVGKGGSSTQITFLGLLFLLIAILTHFTYVLLARSISNWIRNSKGYAKIHRFLFGSVYIFLGFITLTINQPLQNLPAKR